MLVPLSQEGTLIHALSAAFEDQGLYIDVPWNPTSPLALNAFMHHWLEKFFTNKDN